MCDTQLSIEFVATLGESFLKSVGLLRDSLSDLAYILSPHQLAVAQTLVHRSLDSLVEDGESTLVNQFAEWVTMSPARANVWANKNGINIEHLQEIRNSLSFLILHTLEGADAIGCAVQ